MKIIFDIDGTLTDYNRFVDRYALPYFVKKCHMEVIAPAELEIEDIFGMDTLPAGEQQRLLDRFWVSYRFVLFSLFGKFRPGAGQFMRKLKKKGYQVDIYTSRAKACGHNMVGFIARLFTRGQFLLNGVPMGKAHIHFFADDTDKVQAMIQNRPSLVFDDKPSIISQMRENKIPVICVRGRHNTQVAAERAVGVLENVFDGKAEKLMEQVIGKNQFSYYRRAADSEKFFNKLKICKGFLNLYFRPQILHRERLIQNHAGAYIYVSNHRSTLDPLVINAILGRPIHWVALLRFFKAQDSIFNNNKNVWLCKLTAWAFQRLELIPIERVRDNPRANNAKAVRDMIGFLRIGESIGIFPEGTTKRPEGQDFGTFDASFLDMAKLTGAWVQPIVILWDTDSRGKRKVAVNFRPAFQVDGEPQDVYMKQFLQEQEFGLQELGCLLEGAQ